MSAEMLLEPKYIRLRKDMKSTAGAGVMRFTWIMKSEDLNTKGQVLVECLTEYCASAMHAECTIGVMVAPAFCFLQADICNKTPTLAAQKHHGSHPAWPRCDASTYEGDTPHSCDQQLSNSQNYLDK
ncbi:hypothetical protein E2C01_020428 [Portunus trituberculatus]|uniref:Uncharacterized protein n=1 Tax=Portunus trituberculatus TaxID=210409 RepID=A0A5B7DZU7_PORTR|nr:hypothetical protein [Portunus trituberculatus]